MSSTDRQNRLLVAEDWKRIYQSFRNAEFKSYDFDNLRRTMINYLRENYPEDFNDYIESSEYLALIDMISFLGQNIAFRTDLNARENFLELAERRESVLRLARTLSYNPKRNQCANGLLKIESVSTSESIFDSNGLNLQNQTIIWNDPSNPDSQEQFIKIMNAALPVNTPFGRPVKEESVNNIPTQQYRLNSTNTELPVYGFNKTISGVTSRFEIVSSDTTNGSIVEEAPFPGNNFALLYRDDGRGAASGNTGFFVHFRQGTIEDGNFAVTSPSSNQIVAVDATNVNDSDVWLYSVDEFGLEQELWNKVDAVQGNNIIYNSLNKNIRNIYSVLTRASDRISLIFSDGTFGNLPQGNFKVYYRTSKNQRIVIEPSDMRGVSVRIPYLSRTGKSESLNLVFSLQYTVDNSSITETNASIKQNAPSRYYTQNRMITAEDYQIAPLATSQEIIKVKSVNRVSSGLSRYFDLTDATGKYSKTNLFGIDGIITKEFLNPKESFSFVTRTDIEGAIVNVIEPILSNKNIRNFYYNSFPKIRVQDLNVKWNSQSQSTNLYTGFFTNINDLRAQLANFTASTLKLIKPNTLLKFEAPEGFHFMSDNDYQLMSGPADHPGAVTYKWTKVVNIVGDGTEDQPNNVGPVTLSDSIPQGAILTQIIPRLATSLEPSVKTQIVNQVFSYNQFGLRFDRDIGEWRLITTNNLDNTSEFSIGKTGDNTNLQLDASWLLLFETDGDKYTITYRGSRYLFESEKEIRFYFDSSDKVYNSRTGKIVKDKISVLNINKKPNEVAPFTVDFDWEITEEFRDIDGYVDSSKVQVTFFDDDDDGVVDDPDLFEQIVDESNTTIADRFVFFEKQRSIDGTEQFRYKSNSELNIIILQTKELLTNISIYDNGQVFYFVDENVFEVLNTITGTTNISQNYIARIGRDNLKFHYVHAADNNTRIDPSVSNIIDVYMLTRNYDTQFRQYINGTIDQAPLPPSQDSLFNSYGLSLNNIKSLSDTIIMHPVKYKILFGDKASTDLKAKFKIVKNEEQVVNENELKSRVITAINQFFALENWEFGEKFYFSELSAFVMQQLAPDLSTFVVVPTQENRFFGTLFEIGAESDEIFISGANVNDIEIIDSVTATKLKAEGSIVTDYTTNNVGITSTSNSSTSTSSSVVSNSSGSSTSSGSSNGGGYSY